MAGGAEKGYDPRADTKSDKWVPADLRTKPMEINVPALIPSPNADPEALEKSLTAEYQKLHPDEAPG